MQQLQDQLTTCQGQESSVTTFLKSENQSLIVQVQRLQRQLDACQHETPAKREARLLRTENEDIEKLRASIEEAKLDTEKQKASLGDHTLALSKPDTEYKSSLQRKSIR